METQPFLNWTRKEGWWKRERERAPSKMFKKQHIKTVFCVLAMTSRRAVIAHPKIHFNLSSWCLQPTHSNPSKVPMMKHFTHTISTQQKDTRNNDEARYTYTFWCHNKMPKMTMTTKLQIVHDARKFFGSAIFHRPNSLGAVPTMTSDVEVCAASRESKTYRHIQTRSPIKCCKKKSTGKTRSFRFGDFQVPCYSLNDHRLQWQGWIEWSIWTSGFLVPRCVRKFHMFFHMAQSKR